MDDALKARLIGASILVVLAVALLPELLSGPKPVAGEASGGKGTRVITIDLGGAVEASRAPRPDSAPTPGAASPAMPTVAAPAASMTVPEETSAPESVPIDEATVGASDPILPAAVPAQAPSPAATPAAATPAVATPAARTPATTAEPGPAAAATPAPKPSAAAAGKYAVQVGAFSSADGARKLVGELTAAGFTAYVLAPAPGKKLHRVRVGPVADRPAADQLASKLKARGLPVAVTADG